MILNIPDAEYRALPQFNQSSIKDVLKLTPKVFDYGKKNPRKRTSFMDFGSMLHCKLLEPELFNERYKIFKFDDSKLFKPDGSKYKNVKATKVYKSARQQFIDANIGSEIVPDELLDQVLAAEKSARDYCPLFSQRNDPNYNVKTELVIVNEIFGYNFKSKVDLIDINNGIILDVKNTVDSLDDETLEKHILKWDFPIQAVSYSEAAKVEFGIDFTFVFLMVNSFAPYECRYVSMSDVVTHDKFCAATDFIKRGLAKLQQYKDNDPDFYRMNPYVNDNVPPWYIRKYQSNEELI